MSKTLKRRPVDPQRAAYLGGEDWAPPELEQCHGPLLGTFTEGHLVPGRSPRLGSHREPVGQACT